MRLDLQAELEIMLKEFPVIQNRQKQMQKQLENHNNSQKIQDIITKAIDDFKNNQNTDKLGDDVRQM